MKFVDVTNDIAFRKIFGNANKKKSLISFLNAAIDLPQNNRVVDVEITNPYQLSKLASGKSTIVDVKAKDQNGNVFIVEMQIAEFEFFHKRILYYTSQSYTAQIDKGVEYSKLKPVYFIGILEFEISGNPSYFSRHKVQDVETGEQIIRDVEFNFIELPKFAKTLEGLQTSIDQWTYFIKNAENLTVIPENVEDEGLREAYVEADRQNWTKLELEDYERASIKEGDEINRLALAVRRAEEKAALVIKKVEEKAALAAKERIVEIAKQGKTMGLSTADISKLTGLSEEEIEKL